MPKEFDFKAIQTYLIIFLLFLNQTIINLIKQKLTAINFNFTRYLKLLLKNYKALLLINDLFQKKNSKKLLFVFKILKFFL